MSSMYQTGTVWGRIERFKKILKPGFHMIVTVGDLLRHIGDVSPITCDWFVDNKLSIRFGEDKTKSILFSRKNKRSGSKKLDIRRDDIKIHLSVVSGLCP